MSSMISAYGDVLSINYSDISHCFFEELNSFLLAPPGLEGSPQMKATGTQSSISRPVEGRMESPLEIDRGAHESIGKPTATNSALTSSTLVEPHNVDRSCGNGSVAQTSLPPTAASQPEAAGDSQHEHSGTIAPQAATSIPPCSENSKPVSNPIEVPLDTVPRGIPLSRKKKRIRTKKAAAEAVAAGQGEHAAAAPRGDPSLSDSEAVARNPPGQNPTVSGPAPRNGGMQGLNDSEDDYRCVLRI